MRAPLDAAKTDPHPSLEQLEHYELESDEVGDARQWIEQHLKRCEACVAALHEIRRFDYELPQSVGRDVALDRIRNPRRTWRDRLRAFLAGRG